MEFVDDEAKSCYTPNCIIIHEENSNNGFFKEKLQTGIQENLSRILKM